MKAISPILKRIYRKTFGRFAYRGRFLLVQLCVLILAVGVFALGDHSRVAVRLETETLTSGSSITYTFSRPLDHTSFEKAFQLIDEKGAAVAGIFGWSSRRVAFTPTQPLLQGAAYSVVLGDFLEKTGEKRQGFSPVQFTVANRGFVYVNTASQLHWYRLDEKRSTLISEPGEVVIAVAVGSDGSVFYSYRKQRSTKNMGEQLFGLAKLSGDSLSSRQLITGGTTRYFESLRVCGSSNSLVGFEKTRDAKSTILDSSLVTISLQGDVSEIASGSNLSNSLDLVCSSQSDQLAYQGLEGGTTVTSPFSGDEKAVVGRFNALSSFSPKGGWLITSKTNSAGYPVQRSLFGVSETGEVRPLTLDGVDSADGQVDPTDAYLAWSEDARALSSDDFLTRMHIQVKALDMVRTDILQITAPAAETSDEQPLWSPDGRQMTFQRISVTDTGSSRPQTAAGRLLDGEVHLVRLPAFTDSLSGVKPEVTSLGIYGGEVQWLP